MLDIKWIRENPEQLDHALKSRGMKSTSSLLLDLDQKRRNLITQLQNAQEERNALSREIGKLMAQGQKEEAERFKQQVASLKDEMSEWQQEYDQVDAKWIHIMDRLPNVPFEDVPHGIDENDNVEVLRWGNIPQFDKKPLEHFELGEQLGMMHFDKAAQISGARFCILSDQLALLERALGQFMLDLHVKQHGYKEITIPVLVRDDAMYGTAQLPKFEEDLFRTTDDRWLISTGEISLTNLVREEILDQEDLPLRFTTLSQCFRSEAGSAGRDTRGMLRQHQFAKVEMVSITSEDSSVAELERMTQCAEEVLKQLNLPYRKMLLCTGDMGFSSHKTYDLEVWLPGQNSYREISSCSVCGNFQARRMQARYRSGGEKNTHFVHTLNGSGLAVGRCLIAILENYQQSDGSILVPQVLKPYMYGIEKISKAVSCV